MAEIHSNNSALTSYMIFNKTRANSLNDVRTLNMWGYDLKDVSIFQQMPNVEVVSLSMNEISTLRDFSSCLKLRELLLRHNSITNLSEIKYLSNLSRLRRLWLAENPIANQENYRSFVISTLPQLEILDEIPITEEERNGVVRLPRISIEEHENHHCKRLLPDKIVKKNNNQKRNEKFDDPPTNRRKQRFLNDDVLYEKHDTEMKFYDENIDYGNIQNSYYNDENIDYGNIQDNLYRKEKVKNDNYHDNSNQEKDDEARLTAILALLPGLSTNSIGIVLEAISKLAN